MRCKNPGCLKEFKPASGGQKYCTAECQQDYNRTLRRKPQMTKECRNCGKEFTTAIKHQAYCTPRCKLDHESTGRLVNAHGECRQCGKDFTVTNVNKVYCPDCIGTVDPVQEKRTAYERKTKERELAEVLKDEAARTQVVEAICAAQEKHTGWEPRRFNIPDSFKFPEEQANIIFSDWHTGEKLTKKETGGLAEYDQKLERKRLERCVESQAKIISIHTGGGVKIKHCNAWIPGDLITGEKVYKGQPAYIDAYTAEQVVIAKNLLAETLLNMLDIYETITCRAVIGNHPRMGEKGEGPTWNNHDWLTYLWTADLLQNYPQIKWDIPWSWFLVAEVMGWRFCMQHGDDIPMYKRIPWYGMEQDQRDMGDMLWDINESPPYYYIYAHFHTAEQAELVHGERIVNGSLVGGSMLSTKRLKRVSRPSQTFFGLSKKKGITWRYNLYLD